RRDSRARTIQFSRMCGAWAYRWLSWLLDATPSPLPMPRNWRPYLAGQCWTQVGQKATACPQDPGLQDDRLA
ncbi:hypothetical protein M9458_043963, partial [Cirrhinus mrigala]